MSNSTRFAGDLNEMERQRQRRGSAVWDYGKGNDGADGTFLTAPARPQNGTFYDENSAFNK